MADNGGAWRGGWGSMPGEVVEGGRAKRRKDKRGMQEDGKRRHKPNTNKATEEVIEREDRYVWILLYEPGKLYISENASGIGNISMILQYVFLHALFPQDLCNRRSCKTIAFE